MKYLITGYTIINNVRYADGRKIDRVLGGNGIYCLAGMRLFEKDCSLIAAVGEDFDTYYGEWYDRNGLDRSANLVRDAHTMYSDLTYREDGSYTDVSVWGGDSVFHSRDLLLRDSDFLPYLGGLKGLYLYSRWDREFPSAHELQKQFGYKIMWEVTTGIDSSFRPEFDRYLERCDIYSLNYKESRAVFGTDDLGTLIREIKKIGKPCYYRLGRKGAVMIDGGTAAFVPMLSIDPDCEPDATGCGNASTAGDRIGRRRGNTSASTSPVCVSRRRRPSGEVQASLR